MDIAAKLRAIAALSVVALAIVACSTGTGNPSPAAASPSAAGGTGTTVAVLTRLNPGLDPELLRVGQRVRVRP